MLAEWMTWQLLSLMQHQSISLMLNGQEDFEASDKNVTTDKK